MRTKPILFAEALGLGLVIQVLVLGTFIALAVLVPHIVPW